MGVRGGPMMKALIMLALLLPITMSSAHGADVSASGKNQGVEPISDSLTPPPLQALDVEGEGVTSTSPTVECPLGCAEQSSRNIALVVPTYSSQLCQLELMTRGLAKYGNDVFSSLYFIWVDKAPIETTEVRDMISKLGPGASLLHWSDIPSLSLANHEKGAPEGILPDDLHAFFHVGWNLQQLVKLFASEVVTER